MLQTKLLREVEINSAVQVSEAQIKRDTRARGLVAGRLIFLGEKVGTIWLNDARVVSVEVDCLVEVESDPK